MNENSRTPCPDAGLISIIIPIYAVDEKILRECLESVKNQTYQAIEVIAIDDGSPDRSGMICEEYARSDGRFHVWHIQNAGVSNARNTGLEKSTGDYIFFLDADDAVAPDCLEHLMRILRDENADCVKSAVHYVQGKQKSEHTPSEPGQVMELQSTNAVEALCYMKQPFAGVEMTAVWGCLYKRGAIGATRFDRNTPIGEDFAFNYRVFSGISKMMLTDSRLYYYRILETSAMRNGFDARKLAIMDVMDGMITDESCERFRKALMVRYENMAFVLLMMLPSGREFDTYKKKLADRIKKYRKEALVNPRTKGKVRAALLLSYMGADFVRRIFFKFQ